MPMEKDFSSLSNAELIAELKRHGAQVGPIVKTTRKLYERKLMRIWESTNILTPILNSTTEVESKKAVNRTYVISHDEEKENTSHKSDEEKSVAPKELKRLKEKVKENDKKINHLMKTISKQDDEVAKDDYTKRKHSNFNKLTKQKDSARRKHNQTAPFDYAGEKDDTVFTNTNNEMDDTNIPDESPYTTAIGGQVVEPPLVKETISEREVSMVTMVDMSTIQSPSIPRVPYIQADVEASSTTPSYIKRKAAREAMETRWKKELRERKKRKMEPEDDQEVDVTVEKTKPSITQSYFPSIEKMAVIIVILLILMWILSFMEDPAPPLLL